MKKFTAHLVLSRRSAIKGAAAVAAGPAAPALLRIRSACADAEVAKSTGRPALA
jgi:hypothetical protein